MAATKRLDLIDRKELIKAAEKKRFAIVDNTHPYEAMRIQGKYFREVVDNAPTVDAVEVVHGRWDEIPNKYMSVSTKNGSYSGHATSCSVCHEINPNAFKTNYCPNCGAKMDS